MHGILSLIYLYVCNMILISREIKVNSLMLMQQKYFTDEELNIKNLGVTAIILNNFDFEILLDSHHVLFLLLPTLVM